MKKFLFLVCLTLLSSCRSAVVRPDNSVFRESLKEHALAVYKDGRTTFYNAGGIQPLLLHLKNGTFKGAFVADRIIGKASALLLVYGGAEEVYTPLISKPAVEVFKAHNVKYSADKQIDNVLNRRKDGLCPMEQKVKDVSDPARAYEIFSGQM